MRLAEFLRTNLDQIESDWDEFAKTLTPAAANMDVSALRDHLPEILGAIAAEVDMVDEMQSGEFKRMEAHNVERIADRHAAMRLNSGFDLQQIVAEYGALRASVSRRWLRGISDREKPNLNELLRFNGCIDQAIAQLVQRYARDSIKYGDRFVSVLVHDLRTPLNLISIAASSLRERASVTEAGQSNITRILRGVRRIDRLIDDLAVVVRSRLGCSLPLSKARADLGNVCEEAVEEIKASYPNVTVEIHRTGNLIGEWDRERIAQVVSNLVVNAIVHASAKKVDLNIEDAGSLVTLSVCNQGSPIPAAMLESIFEPSVHKGDGASEALSSGLGLGLFIVRQIVEAHRGTVQVTSSEPKGTIFMVQLPRASD
ncbi:MAG TPA: sensor histidine kinase [Candidatus Binataceae bacterium]|nr:sensor histidine kinase [Candidatus Binataceae bacterium]